MAAVPIFRAEVKPAKGKPWKLEPHMLANDAYHQYFDGSFRPGEIVEVMVRPRRRNPTVQMHRYYRGVLLPAIAEAMGETRLSAHRILKREFFASSVSLATISRRLFADFLRFCERIAAWLGLWLWDRNEFEFVA